MRFLMKLFNTNTISSRIDTENLGIDLLELLKLYRAHVVHRLIYIVNVSGAQIK